MEIVLRATVTFAFLLLLTRGLRRRTLADMAPFEMILLIVVGDIVQQGITQEDMSLTGSVIAVSTFGFWVTVISYLPWRFEALAKVVDGVPVLLVRDGEPIEPGLEPVFAEHGVHPLVVDGRVRVDPVALRIHREREHLRQRGALQQDLVPRHQVRQEVQFLLVHLE